MNLKMKNVFLEYESGFIDMNQRPLGRRYLFGACFFNHSNQFDLIFIDWHIVLNTASKGNIFNGVLAILRVFISVTNV